MLFVCGVQILCSNPVRVLSRNTTLTHGSPPPPPSCALPTRLLIEGERCVCVGFGGWVEGRKQVESPNDPVGPHQAFFLVAPHPPHPHSHIAPFHRPVLSRRHHTSPPLPFPSRGISYFPCLSHPTHPLSTARSFNRRRGQIGGQESVPPEPSAAQQQQASTAQKKMKNNSKKIRKTIVSK